ncbi:hypothetical protein [Nostoc sp.]|uniref:hypothetical protein n=1 Tax=Nostoc sp. TaxID=1180 RepID=UPI002FFA4681
MLNRVAEITIYFWITKILATTVGETAIDFLSVTLNLGLGVISYIMFWYCRNQYTFSFYNRKPGYLLKS